MGQWRDRHRLWGIYGEQQESRPAGYSCDWWASDLIDALGTPDDVEAFATICKRP